MKSIKITVVTLLILVLLNDIYVAYASDDAILRNRIFKIDNFKSEFNQFINKNNNDINIGSGYLYIKRPNMFKFHVIRPIESIVVTDGVEILFYNPSMNIAIKRELFDINNVILEILLNSSSNFWKNFRIFRDKDTFFIFPKNKIKYNNFIINIDKEGVINEFKIFLSKKKYINFVLKNHDYDELSDKLFDLSLPENVIID
ncbi:outer-membrane lipoprotein carrier protein [endosymbiont of Sipalinus gigas]|uniref:outer membrane lipoprotein chaperone LolA n=1 Tax=endosymbiont of Sipalinus gigas TaxID=1972134 RepID=UPI000DC72C65|nr:outer membrane lipoprotein chaperone LolA [endosymbiont of Sipalinus gigas]BBA85167.1 outer-membrane lipoprotein carrier protein [endosymbiont of Sipalinus gigas]